MSGAATNDLFSKLPLVVLVVAFAAISFGEYLHAARPGRRGWRRVRRNLLISLTGIVVSGMTAGTLLGLSALVEDKHWGLSGATGVPAWILALAGLLLLDLADYWRHRLSHIVPALWRLHRVHHSDLKLDVTSSLRSHPLEFVLRPIVFGITIVTFGIPILAVLLHPILQLPVLIFQHANLRLPETVDSVLTALISTPAMHLVHHSCQTRETNSNYATLLTVWDRIFGSLHPSNPPEAIGLSGYNDERRQSLHGLLVEPWQNPAGEAAVSIATITSFD
jgi:sterol desaturase/sphingolipid hydroxylase (fatty acid hydroxylase superfamily)